MTDKIGLTKLVVGLVVGQGVSIIVSGIVANNVVSVKPWQKVFIFAGKTGLSMVLNDVTTKHTDEKIDAAVEWWTAASKEAKK